MKRNTIAYEITALLLCASVVLAQGPGGPRGGGPMMAPGGPGGIGGRGGMEMPGRTVTGAPYSAVEVLTIQEKYADGNVVNSTTSRTVARDNAGRTYSSETITPAAASGKAPFTRTVITDNVAGYRYELNSSTMIATQSRLPQMHAGPPQAVSPAQRPAAARQATSGTETLPNGAVRTRSSQGTAVVNGILAEHSLVTETIPAGAIGNEKPITTSRTTWVSHELNLPVRIQTVDARGATSDMELTNLAAAEPSAALFQVPAGYTVKKAGPEMGRGSRGPGGPGAFRRGGPPAQ
jgi:hypothetical protein